MYTIRFFDGTERQFETLTGANLRGANLADADLTGADLRWADLRWADLRGANLADAIGLPSAPIVPNLESAILAQIEQPDCRLRMADWHTCETTHCRAGWAVHLAGEAGYALEKQLGPAMAGALIYHASCGYVPNFYDTNEDALADIKARAGR